MVTSLFRACSFCAFALTICLTLSSRLHAEDPCYVWVQLVCDDAPVGGCDQKNCKHEGVVTFPIDTDGDGVDDDVYKENKYKCYVDTNGDGEVGDDERPYGNYMGMGYYSDCMEESTAILMEDLGGGDVGYIEDYGYENSGAQHDFNGDSILSDSDKNIQYCWDRGKCAINNCSETSEDPPIAFCAESPSPEWEPDPASKEDKDVCWKDGTGRCEFDYYYYGPYYYYY